MVRLSDMQVLQFVKMPQGKEAVVQATRTSTKKTEREAIGWIIFPFFSSNTITICKIRKPRRVCFVCFVFVGESVGLCDPDRDRGEVEGSAKA